MQPSPRRITPFLWFDDQAEEAARFYTSIFDDSRIVSVTRYGAPASGRPEGSVMTVAFELDGQHFTALNGGPHFRFNEAISLSSAAGIRRRWTTTGAASPKAGTRRHSSAAG